MFQRACELGDIEKGNALHVGDSYKKDYLPAISVGMKAVLVSDRSSHDCVRVDKFQDLLPLLNSRLTSTV